MPYCLVVGDPIAHSLSPVIHLAAYRELGLNWDFRCQRVRSGTLKAFLLAAADSQLRGHFCRRLGQGHRGGEYAGPRRGRRLDRI